MALRYSDVVARRRRQRRHSETPAAHSFESALPPTTSPPNPTRGLLQRTVGPGPEAVAVQGAGLGRSRPPRAAPSTPSYSDVLSGARAAPRRRLAATTPQPPPARSPPRPKHVEMPPPLDQQQDQAMCEGEEEDEPEGRAVWPPPTETTCRVCLEEFADAPLVLLECGHYFHTDCAKRWFDNCQQSPRGCPLCRQPLAGKEWFSCDGGATSECPADWEGMDATQAQSPLSLFDSVFRLRMAGLVDIHASADLLASDDETDDDMDDFFLEALEFFTRRSSPVVPPEPTPPSPPPPPETFAGTWHTVTVNVPGLDMPLAQSSAARAAQEAREAAERLYQYHAAYMSAHAVVPPMGPPQPGYDYGPSHGYPSHGYPSHGYYAQEAAYTPNYGYYGYGYGGANGGYWPMPEPVPPPEPVYYADPYPHPHPPWGWHTPDFFLPPGPRPTAAPSSPGPPQGRPPDAARFHRA